jgi:uncharacterized protein (DUF1778 family)
MKYSELMESGASLAQRQEFLTAGDPTPITLRVPKNMKDAAAEAAKLRGVSFSAFVRNCVINELAGRG